MGEWMEYHGWLEEALWVVFQKAIVLAISAWSLSQSSLPTMTVLRTDGSLIWIQIRITKDTWSGVPSPSSDLGSLRSGPQEFNFQNISDHQPWEYMSGIVDVDLLHALVVPVLKVPFLLPKFPIRWRLIEPVSSSWSITGIREWYFSSLTYRIMLIFDYTCFKIYFCH